MDQKSLWNKLKTSAGNAGKEIVHQALLLFYAYPHAPKKVQAVIASSLAYFIMPLDAVPDPIPFLGFLDDATILAAALGIVRMYVNDEVKTKANSAMERFFKKA